MKKKKEDKTSLSQQSGISGTSVGETSEDDEARKKAAKKSKHKELSEAELKKLIDIELCETETLTLIHIPGVIVPHETDEYNIVVDNNKKYTELLANKVGSDNYAVRGS